MGPRRRKEKTGFQTHIGKNEYVPDLRVQVAKHLDVHTFSNQFKDRVFLHHIHIRLKLKDLWLVASRLD